MARTVIITLLADLMAAHAIPAPQQRQRPATCLLPAESAVAMAALAMAAHAVRFMVLLAAPIIAILALLDITVIRAVRCCRLFPFRSELSRSFGCARLVIGPTQAAAKSTGVNGATRPAPIRAALTTMLVRARLDIAELPLVMELLDAILAAPPVAMADMVTVTATA